MGLSLRQAVPSDYPAICDLVTDEEELFLVYPKGAFPLTVEQLVELLARRLEPTVLLSGDTVVGFACLYGYRPQKSAFIGNVVIKESHRGQGLGEVIVSHLIRVAFQKYDLPRVKISVYSQNAAALLLYGRLGFKPYTVREMKGFDGERMALLTLRLKRSAHTMAAEG